MPTQQNSFSVSSKHYSDHIDSTFIGMVRAIAVEFSLPIDPDAKETGRCIVQDKMNSIIPPEAKEMIKRFADATKKAIQDPKSLIGSEEEYVRLAYQTLKVMRLDE